MRLRVAIGVLGVLAIGFGAVLILLQEPGRIPRILVWLAGPLAVHDGLLAPATLGLAWLGRRVLPRRVWGPAVVGLALAGTTVLLALPLLLSPADGTVPGLLDRNYPRGVVIGLLAAALITGLLATLGRGRRPSREAESGDGD